MRDPYEILGVQKNATPAAIKSAFRRLAKKLHPDANKTDKTAATKFAELNAAYEIVGDEDKRKAFDRGEIDAEGKPRFQGFPGGGGAAAAGRAAWGGGAARTATSKASPGARMASSAAAAAAPAAFVRGGGIDDILKEMFGGAAAARPAAQSSSRRISAGRRRAATSPAPSPSRCRRLLTGTSRRVQLPTGKEIDAKIPAGLADGQTIRLKGQGLPGPGGAAGDALITVTIAEHPLFKRDGANLRLELPVTLYEAVLGGKVRVPTLDGAVRACHSARHQLGPHPPRQGQGPAGQRTAPAISTRRCASCCPRAATPSSRS